MYRMHFKITNQRRPIHEENEEMEWYGYCRYNTEINNRNTTNRNIHTNKQNETYTHTQRTINI